MSKMINILLKLSKTYTIIIVISTIVLGVLPIFEMYFVSNLFQKIEINSNIKVSVIAVFVVFVIKILVGIIINFPRSFFLYTKVPMLLKEKFIVHQFFNGILIKEELASFYKKYIDEVKWQKYIFSFINYHLNFVVIFCILIINIKTTPYLIIPLIVGYGYKRIIIEKFMNIIDNHIMKVTESNTEYNYEAVNFFDSTYIQKLYLENELKINLDGFLSDKRKLLNREKKYEKAVIKEQAKGKLMTSSFYITILLLNLLLLKLEWLTIYNFSISIVTVDLVINLLLEQEKNYFDLKSLQTEFNKFITITSALGLEKKSIKFINKLKYTNELINFEISKGDKIHISGESGSGKTTLLNIIMGFEADDKDHSIQIDETNVPNSFFISNATYINQKILLFSNELIADGSSGEKRIEHMKKQIDLTSELYIFDEPFVNLDIENKEFIIKFIQEELKNKTVIITSHELPDELSGFFDCFEMEKNDNIFKASFT